MEEKKEKTTDSVESKETTKTVESKEEKVEHKKTEDKGTKSETESETKEEVKEEEPKAEDKEESNKEEKTEDSKEEEKEDKKEEEEKSTEESKEEKVEHKKEEIKETKKEEKKEEEKEEKSEDSKEDKKESTEHKEKKKEHKKSEHKETKSEKTHKHVSDVKEEKNSFWKIASIVLAVVVAFLLVSIGLRLATGNMDKPSFEDEMNQKVNETTNQTDGNVYELLVVEDPECINCQVDYFVEQIEESLIQGLVSEKITYDSETGIKIISELGIKIAPIFLFSKNVEEREDWEKLQQVLIPVEIASGEYYLLNPMVLQVKTLVESPIITDTAITIGDENATVTLVEFSDFECPVCAIMKGSPKLTEELQLQSPDFEPALPKIMEEYVETGKVKYVFYNFPIDKLHPKARISHNAVLCSNEQGKFKEFSDMLYENREEWVDGNETENILKGYAKELNLDKADFAECLDTAKYNDQIDSEIQLALPYGISGTPTYFVNKQIVTGLTTYEDFKVIIEQELAK